MSIDPQLLALTDSNPRPDIFVVIVATDDTAALIHYISTDAKAALTWARTCHLCLDIGDYLIVQGWLLGENGGWEPTEVRVDRVELQGPLDLAPAQQLLEPGNG